MAASPERSVQNPPVEGRSPDAAAPAPSRRPGVLERIHELLSGLERPFCGGCAGDPAAWDFDAKRRVQERESDARAERRDPAHAGR